MLFRTAWVCALLLGGWHSAQAALDSPMAAQLALMFPVGSCVRYVEGGEGVIMVAPTYFLAGRVVASRSEFRELPVCPARPGASPSRERRETMIERARAWPCRDATAAVTTAEVGQVRLAVTHWETPYERRLANVGRLYRGAYLDIPLQTGVEIEMPADLLQRCAP